MIVKITSKQPADVIPQIGFNACYKDVVGSPDKCLAFAIIQSCAASQRVAYGSTDGSASGYVPQGGASTMVGQGQSYGATTQTAPTQGSQQASTTSRAAAGAALMLFASPCILIVGYRIE